MVDHDDRHDAAERRADDPDLCHHQPGPTRRGQPYTPTVLFASGYLLAWGGFSVSATLAQWGLERATLLSPMAMKTTSPLLGGLLFIAAGLYQFTPLKKACLRSAARRSISSSTTGATAPAGAVRMGLRTASTASAAAGS